MKRGGPLRSDPEKARAFQQRGRGKLKRTAMKRSPAEPKAKGSRGFSSKVRADVHRRSGGWCEAAIVGVCTGWAEHMHHRKPRANGDHSAANALDCCSDCHNAHPLSIHKNPEWAYRHGLLLHSYDDPEKVAPVTGAQP